METQLEHAAGGDNVRAIIDLATGSVGVKNLDETGALIGVVLPQESSFQVRDLHEYLDKYREAPERLKGAVRVQKVEDLVRYVKRFDKPELTTIWLDAKSHSVVAVLNDHGDDSPQWGDHRASLTLEHTPEWQHWLSLNGQLVGQERFAEHIEEGLDEIIAPDGATMLEIAQSIAGSVDASFRSSHRLQSGAVKFSYVEEVDAAAGKDGELEIPKTFTLALPPFIGEDASPIVARFRYRMHSQKLTLGYHLERPWQVEREAVDRIAVKLATTFEGERVFIGSPRS